MAYMIERQYGRCNRDWLHSLEDGSTCWVLGPHRAMIFDTREDAELALEQVEQSAEQWDNREHFEFVIIQDRRKLPSYFASHVMA